MIEVEFLDLAQDELDDAFEYYEYQQANLGYRFVQETYNTLTLIKEYPSAWTQNSEHTRRCLIRSFPYAVIYHQKENIIIIVAIANLHKEPNYWAKRIRK